MSYSITIDATTPDPTYFNGAASIPAGLYQAVYNTGAWMWVASDPTPWIVGRVTVTCGAFAENYLRITGALTVDSFSGSGPERAFELGDVGKTLRITGGTGFTVGDYTVQSVAAGVATLDRSPGTNGSTNGSGKLSSSTGLFDLHDMGISATRFASQALAQAAAPPGASIVFSHPGGPLGAYVVDGF